MRALVVEDEKEIQTYLKKNLQAEHFAVDTADDGEAGSFLARTNDYDIIVLDNIMPKKNGLVVCEDIRLDGSDVPIIVLSVKSETNSKVDLLNAGADDYLTKPFSFEELLARMRALMRRPKKIESVILHVDNLVLDSTKQSVERNGENIYLTRKEYALLKYLMKNQGVVLSKPMLLEHVWDMNVDPFSNTVESHIASLRRKIDKVGEKNLINTVTGRGYRFGE